MKIFKKILLALAVLIVLTLIAGGIFIYRIGHKGITSYGDDVKLPILKEDVTVIRDSLGIPSIYAKNEKDLYAVTGYLLAQDRLWQMDLLRRVTLGRLSEIFGDDLINTDLMMRALRIPQKSKMVLEKTDTSIIEALQAFANGVNYYIETHQNQLPPEFTILGYKPEKWESVHSVNLIGYMAWDLSCGLSEELLLHMIKNKVDSSKFKLLIPEIKSIKDVVYPDFKLCESARKACKNLTGSTQKLEDLGLKIFSGSNNWAVAGKKSTTGKPILANDMHLGLFSPGIWYQVHQVIEGQMNVTGVLLPGQPFVISGHNDSIAWGMTNVMVDDLDLYKETVKPGDTSKYLFNGQWRDMKIVKETIKSKSGKVVEKEIYFTHRGPVISRLKNMDTTVISMRWLGNEYSNELRSVYLVDKGKNWCDFKNAMSTFSATSQNVVYADVNGNIGLYCCAGIPIRKGNGILVAPGDTCEYDWKGFVPFDKLPHVYNPECGYVISANNKTVGDDYPYYISHWFQQPDRFNRIKQMIEAKEKLSPEDFRTIQTDWKSLLPGQFLPDILTVLKALKSLSDNEKKSLDILEKWDYLYTAESQAALIFEKLYINLLTKISKDELGEDLTKELLDNRAVNWAFMLNLWKNKNSAWFDDVTIKDKVETFDMIVESSYKQTISDISALLGNNIDQWQWGKVHQLKLKHPMGTVKVLDKIFHFNTPSYPEGGSYHTVCPYSYDFTNQFIVNHGASERHVYPAGYWDESQTVIPTGTSGIPASPYYCNQTALYAHSQYHTDVVSKEAVQKKQKFVQKFTK